MELIKWATSQFFPPIALGLAALSVRWFVCQATYVGSDLFFGVSIVYLLFGLDGLKCGDLLHLKMGAQIIIWSLGLISIASSIIMLINELRLEHSRINPTAMQYSHVLHGSSTKRAKLSYVYCWILLCTLLLLCIMLILYNWI